jgi:hypothetical protein
MIRRLIVSALLLASLGLLAGSDATCFLDSRGNTSGGVIVD